MRLFAVEMVGTCPALMGFSHDEEVLCGRGCQLDRLQGRHERRNICPADVGALECHVTWQRFVEEGV
jgi:hypothetical protein